MKSYQLKSLIFLILFLAALLIYNKWLHNQEVKELKEEKQELILKWEKELIAESDYQKAQADSLISSIKSEVNNLAKYSQSVIKEIEQYEKRPNYSIDFAAASVIISESSYRPSESNRNP